MWVEVDVARHMSYMSHMSHMSQMRDKSHMQGGADPAKKTNRVLPMTADYTPIRAFTATDFDDLLKLNRFTRYAVVVYRDTTVRTRSLFPLATLDGAKKTPRVQMKPRTFYVNEDKDRKISQELRVVVGDIVICGPNQELYVADRGDYDIGATQDRLTPKATAATAARGYFVNDRLWHILIAEYGAPKMDRGSLYVELISDSHQTKMVKQGDFVVVGLRGTPRAQGAQGTSGAPRVKTDSPRREGRLSTKDAIDARDAPAFDVYTKTRMAVEFAQSTRAKKATLALNTWHY